MGRDAQEHEEDRGRSFSTPADGFQRRQIAAVHDLAYASPEAYLEAWCQKVIGGNLQGSLDGLGEGTVTLAIGFPGLSRPRMLEGRVLSLPQGKVLRIQDDSARRTLSRLALRAIDLIQSLPRKAAHILVVDDNELAQRSVGRVVRYLSESSPREFTVEFAAHGEEAMRAVEARTPDLLVTDLSMPVISGGELVRWLRKEEQNFPILVLSAGDPAREKELFEAGIHGFLRKPVTFGQLLETLVYVMVPRPLVASAET